MTMQSEDAPRAAGVTHLQGLITNTINAAQSSKTSEDQDGVKTFGPGDDWQPIITRWISYIPESKLFFPSYSGNPSKPYTFIGGDGHGTNQPNHSSYRTRQDILFWFGSSHGSSYSEDHGFSYLYHCANSNGTNCDQVGGIKQSNAYLDAPVRVSGQTSA